MTQSQSSTAAVPVGSLRPLVRYLRPHWGKLTVACVALSASSALFFLIGIGLSRLTDVIGSGAEGGKALDHFVVLSYLVLSAFAVGVFVRSYLMRWVGERIGTDLRRDVFARLAQLRPSFYDRHPYGEIQSRVTTDTMALQSVIGGAIPNGVHYTLLLVSSMVYAAWLSPRLSLAVLACIPVIFLPSALFSRQVARLAADKQTALAASGAHVGEILRNLKLVQAYRYEGRAVSRYAQLLEQGFDINVRNVRIEAWLTTVTSFLSFGGLVVVIWLGGHQVVSQALSLGDLIAFVFYGNLTVTAAAALVNVYISARNAAGAAARVMELRDSPLEPRALAPKRPPQGDIVFEGVGFAYPTRPDQPVFVGLDLCIRRGETLAVVGASGAGKSTLFDLILGGHNPSTGRVTVGGVDRAEIDRDAWLDVIAFVPQNPELLSGTVIDNLRLGAPDAGEDAVWQAAEAAHIGDFIRSLPQGMHTSLGQDASRLSGGQRQRLAIARALVRNPRVLLLDEPTSALDAESEAGVQLALDTRQPGRSTVIVTHRIETAMRADRIAMLHQGRVLAVGSHRQLMESSPEYAALVQLQAERAPAPEPLQEVS